MVAKPAIFVLWVLKEMNDTCSFRLEHSMTENQKRLIDQYRQSGMKYSEIARTIGLPETTVKSYCYRNPVTSPQPVPTGPVCPQCGKPITSGKFRPRRFCSDACRNKYWLTHHEATASRAGKKVICQHCGKSFTDYANRHRKYCSHPCYIAARYGGDQHE